MGGIVVSWAAFACAMVVLYYLARLDLPRRRAERAVLLSAIFPFAFFFGAVYSEALFLAAVVSSFYLFRTRHWILGGLCGAVATATRVNGILMLPALMWVVWQQFRSQATDARTPRRDIEAPRQRDWVWAVAGLACVVAGVGLYSLYIYRLTGHPLEWMATIQRWGYYPGGSPLSVFFALGRAALTHPYAFLAGERLAPYDTLNGLAAVVAVAAVPFVWWRLGAAYGLFMAANLWLPLSSGQVEGLGRYVAVMFPFFIWLATIRSRHLYTFVVVAFGMLYTLCLALFTNIHPIF